MKSMPCSSCGEYGRYKATTQHSGWPHLNLCHDEEKSCYYSVLRQWGLPLA